MAVFEIKSSVQGDSAVLSLEGRLDEDAELIPVSDLKAKEIVIDLALLKVINSCGIRDWIKWTATFKKDVPVKLKNCPKIIIDQMNMISNFIPKHFAVASFSVPYFCDSCQQTTTLLIDINDKTKPQLAEKTKCKNCGAEAELDVFDHFLNFIGTQ